MPSGGCAAANRTETREIVLLEFPSVSPLASRFASRTAERFPTMKTSPGSGSGLADQYPLDSDAVKSRTRRCRGNNQRADAANYDAVKIGTPARDLRHWDRCRQLRFFR